MAKRVILIGYGFRDPANRLIETLDPEKLARLRGIDPEVEVVYAPMGQDLSILTIMKSGEPGAMKALLPRFPKAYLDALPRADILLTIYAPWDLVARSPKLGWIANAGSGTDQYKALALPPDRITLTSAKGVASRSIAEFAMSQLLVMARNWPGRMENQRNRVWGWVKKNRDIRGLTLGIVGLGEIGIETARLAKAFGMRVIASKRTVGDRPPEVDELLPSDRLHELLGRSDAVLLSLAFTEKTAGLFDRAAYAAMKPGAFLINLSRGGIADESALVENLQSGRLGGAAFDVFNDEPLPKESPLWAAPNLLITAHNSVGLEDYGAAVFDRFVENFARHVRGERLLGTVDLAEGY